LSIDIINDGVYNIGGCRVCDGFVADSTPKITNYNCINKIIQQAWVQSCYYTFMYNSQAREHRINSNSLVMQKSSQSIMQR